MFIARWQIDARFGHKQAALELLRKWEREIGPQGRAAPRWSSAPHRVDRRPGGDDRGQPQGPDPRRPRGLSSTSSPRSPTHAAWGKELEPHVVSGTSRWESSGC